MECLLGRASYSIVTSGKMVFLSSRKGKRRALFMSTYEVASSLIQITVRSMNELNRSRVQIREIKEVAQAVCCRSEH